MRRFIPSLILPLLLLSLPGPAGAQLPDAAFRKSEFVKAEEVLRADDLLKLRKERDDKELDTQRQKAMENSAELTRDRLLSSTTSPVLLTTQALMMSPIEDLFLTDLKQIDPFFTPERFRDEIKRFGVDLFARPQLFVPATSLPASPDYRVGPEDGLLIHVWNPTVDEVFPVEVTREGRALLPKLGEKFVDGFDLGLLERHLQAEYGRIYSNASVSVSLSKLKSVTVFVVGEVRNPGSYNLPGFSTTLNALVAAGGPSEVGSLRKVVLKRPGAPDVALDLYDFLLRGDRAADRTLRSGDTVFMPVVGPQVLLYGPVRRPGLYELRDGTTVRAAVAMAGGLNAAGYRPTLKLVRTAEGRRRVLRDIDLAGDGDTELRDGDFLYVGPVFEVVENYVKILGHVERPGSYQYVKGMRLLDLVGRGVRLLPDTYMERAELVRYLGVGRDYDYAEDDIKRRVQTELIPVDLKRLFAGDRAANLELKPMDELNVYAWDDIRPMPQVTIAGAVTRPGPYPLRSGMRLKDLVYTAGNLTKDAMLETCEIMRREVVDEKSRTYSEKLIAVSLRDAMAGTGTANVELLNYDVVTVLAIREKILEKRVTLSGELRNPGVYVIRDGEKLSSLLRRAGGFTAKAFLPGAVFSREAVKEKQRLGLQKAVQELQRKVTEVQAEVALRAEEEASSQDLAAIDSQKKRVQEFATLEPNGRINIRLLPIDVLEKSEFDLVLKEGDRLLVPEIPADVTLVGEVVNPGSVLYEEGKSVDHYINRLGGFNQYADPQRVFVIKSDGTTITRMSFGRGKNRFLLRYEPDLTRQVSSGSFMEMKVDRGDVIQVPARVVTKRTSTKDLVDVVYKITLSFAGIKAAFK